MPPTDPRTGGRSSDRREAILDAATACFAEKGVARTSIADIRRASGASVGSIYHHFGGKEGLTAAILHVAFADYQKDALEIIEGDPTAEDGVKGLARNHSRWIAAHPEQVRFILAPRDPAVSLSGQRDLGKMNRAFLRKVGAWRDRRVAEGSVRDVPSAQFYSLLIGPGQEYARLWFEGRGVLPIAAVAEEFARAAWQALRNDTA